VKFNFKKAIGIGLLAAGALYIVNKVVNAINEEKITELDEIAIGDISEINQFTQEAGHIPKQQEKKKEKEAKKSAKQEKEKAKRMAKRVKEKQIK